MPVVATLGQRFAKEKPFKVYDFSLFTLQLKQRLWL
jgi:hypothetical protein